MNRHHHYLKVKTELLFDIIRKLKEKGTSIIFITHRLDEIYAVCDRMTILRDGCYIGSRDVKDVTKNEMIEMMIGRKLTNQYPSRESVIGETVLEVKKYFGWWKKSQECVISGSFW